MDNWSPIAYQWSYPAANRTLTYAVDVPGWGGVRGGRGGEGRGGVGFSYERERERERERWRRRERYI